VCDTIDDAGSRQRDLIAKPTGADRMTVTTTCRSCGGDHRNYAGKLEGTQRVAEAIAQGDDFGGVFELGNELAKARTKIGIGGDSTTADAQLAAVSLQAIQARVSRQFARIEGRRGACRLCELRHLLATLMHTATRAVADDRQGVAASWESDLIDACESLASYAGDDYPDEDATLSVLALARDVFLAALVAMSPEARPR
jgi:hypothetical protein